MTQAEVDALLARAFCLRLGTVGTDGWPYVVPLLFVVIDDAVFVHTTAAAGHLRNSVLRESRVCFEIDEPGEVFGYGASECDTSLSYQSVIAFGYIKDVEDHALKARFCTALMHKYASHIEARPQGVYPRIDRIRVYSIALERVTGKQTPLPR